MHNLAATTTTSCRWHRSELIYFLIYILLTFNVFIIISIASYQQTSSNLKHTYKHHQEGDHQSHDDSSQESSKYQATLFDVHFAPAKSLDESKLRLAQLVDEKIDQNGDGLVQLDELVGWLRQCHEKYAWEEVKRHWLVMGKRLIDDDGKVHKEGDDSSIAWKEYAAREYEHLRVLSQKHADHHPHSGRIKQSHEYHLQRDLRRWRAADLNQDGRLNGTEFKAFLQPENYEHMHKLVLEERFEALDKNGDEKVSIEEYLSDLQGPNGNHLSEAPVSNKNNVDEKNDDRDREQKWLQAERDKFSTQLDTNHNNLLDRNELARWLSKSELHDHSVSEAQHLLQSADLNRDHRLTKEEILGAYYEFVNSHATDFGEALQGNPHKQPEERDEL